MTLLSEETPALLLEVVRGDRSRRPRRDSESAAGLRAELEDVVFDHLGPERREVPWRISSATVRGGPPAGPYVGGTLSRARGVLITTALRLLVAQVHVDDPYDDALKAWRARRAGSELLEQVDHLDADQAARLHAEVAAHFETLQRLGPIPSNWSPRTCQRAYQMLGGGNVFLGDVVDLVVGSPHHESTNVALVDITTSPLGIGAERVMRYHALIQTLRTSVVPLRTSMFSSATGELRTLDVDRELLMRGVEDLTHIISRLGETS